MIDVKKKVPILYARLSQAEAKSEGGRKLNDQIKSMKKWLKENGFRKEPMIFKEVASGTDPTRPQWKAAINAAKAKKNAVFVVRDFTRWSRDMRTGMSASIPLYENDIPIIATVEGISNMAGTRAHPNPNGDLLWGLKTSIGTSDVERTKSIERETRSRLQEEGISTVPGFSLYPFAAKNPWAVLIENYPRLNSDLKPARFGELIALETKVGKKLFSPGDKWYRTAVENWLEIKKQLPDEKEYAEWWDFFNRVRDYERSEGYDGAGRGYVTKRGRKTMILDKGGLSWKVKALRRMTNAYMRFPSQYPKPTEEQWVEWIANYPNYLSVKDFKVWSRLSPELQ